MSLGVKYEKSGSSSKVLKMEAYDAAVLSYALATAKLKPGFMVPPSKLNEMESLTPPSRQESDIDGRTFLYQLLCGIEQNIINKNVVHIHQLMEICSTKLNQNDQGTIANLEAMQHELMQICKVNAGATHSLQLCVDGENYSIQGTLRSETICKSLTDLLKQFGLTIGSNMLRKCI